MYTQKKILADDVSVNIFAGLIAFWAEGAVVYLRIMVGFFGLLIGKSSNGVPGFPSSDFDV